MEPFRIMNNPLLFDISGMSLCLMIIIRVIKLEKIKKKRGEKNE